MSLQSKLKRIVDHWDWVFIRIQREGKFMSISLYEATDKEIAIWLSEYILRDYIESVV